MDSAGDVSPAADDSARDDPVQEDPVQEDPVLPDMVVAPAHPANESTEIVFEVRPGEDGVNVLPVFSTVRQLVATFGPAQPWVALPLRKARELAAAGGIPEVVLDPVVPPSAWRWHYSDLEELARSLG